MAAPASFTAERLASEETGLSGEFAKALQYFREVFTDNDPDGFVAVMPKDPAEIEAQLQTHLTLAQAGRLAGLGSSPEPVPMAEDPTREFNAALREAQETWLKEHAPTQVEAAATQAAWQAYREAAADVLKVAVERTLHDQETERKLLIEPTGESIVEALRFIRPQGTFWTSSPIAAKVLDGGVSLATLSVPNMMGDPVPSASFYYGGDSGAAAYKRKGPAGKTKSVKGKQHGWIWEYFDSVHRQERSIETVALSGQGASRIGQEMHRLRARNAKENWAISECVIHYHFNDRLDPAHHAQWQWLPMPPPNWAASVTAMIKGMQSVSSRCCIIGAIPPHKVRAYRSEDQQIIEAANQELRALCKKET